MKRDPSGYRRLCRIGLEYGRQYEIASVRLGTVAFAEELDRAGIPHSLDGFTGGHADHTRRRFEQAVLPFFARAFTATE